MRLTTRYLLVCGVAVVASCLVVGWVLMRTTMTDLEEVFRTSAQHRAELIAEGAEDNPESALNTVVTEGSPVVAVTLYDESFHVVATRSQSAYDVPPPTSETIRAISSDERSGVADFELDNEMMLSIAKVESGPVRHVAAVLSKRTLDETMAQASQLGFLTTVVLATVAVFIALFVVRRVTRPLAQVSQAVVDLERGEFDRNALTGAERRRDEMGLLARRFAAMADEVQARERRLAEQVSTLQVRIDESDRQRSVERITGTESFADLQDRARQMRDRRAAATQRGTSSRHEDAAGAGPSTPRGSRAAPRSAQEPRGAARGGASSGISGDSSGIHGSGSGDGEGEEEP